MTPLRERIARASPRTEFVFVCLLAFGMFSVTSVVAVIAMTALTEAPNAGHAVIDQSHVVRLVVYELAVLCGLGWSLRVRGWTAVRIGLQPSWSATGIGVLLAAAAFLSSGLVSSVVLANSSSLAAIVERTHPVAAPTSAGALVAVCIVNPLFEEVFVSGYLVTALKRARSASFAANSSAAVRLLYHLYQGPLAVIGILPIGLLFGYWYARTARLWPLVVAHALLDAIAIAAYQ